MGSLRFWHQNHQITLTIKYFNHWNVFMQRLMLRVKHRRSWSSKLFLKSLWKDSFKKEGSRIIYHALMWRNPQDLYCNLEEHGLLPLNLTLLQWRILGERFWTDFCYELEGLKWREKWVLSDLKPSKTNPQSSQKIPTLIVLFSEV